MREAQSQTLPIGPVCDTAPRPLPVRQALEGAFVRLEPLHPRHTADLWEAAEGEDDSWAYMGYGPFASVAAMRAQIENFASLHDPMMWAIRRVATGRVEGWLGLLDIQPGNAAIELGHIWFGPNLRRTRAATEAMYLALRYAAEDLGYRRLVWKCNALNAGSIRAAERLGFQPEGVLRAHLVVKGRLRDTAYFSILADEWPLCANAIRAWMDDENFGPDGLALNGLAAMWDRLRA